LKTTLAIKDGCILYSGEVDELSKEERRLDLRSLVGALERAITRKDYGGGKPMRCRRPPCRRALVDGGSGALLVFVV